MGPVLLLLALLAAACAGVRGNTEIRHFRPSAGGHAHPSQRVLDLVAAAIPNQAVLAGPYTISGIEEVAPAGSAIAGDAAKARWYRLQGLEPGRSYEVRISYAASTPADFGIALYTVAEIMDRHGIALDDRGAAQDGVTMYARVTATYTGVSRIPGMEDRPVPYIIVLEKHVLGIPVQALKLVAVLVAVVALGLFVIVPRVLAEADAVLAEPLKED